MKLTFVSNYINHHQIPLAEVLYSHLGEDYRFLQTEPMEEERVRMGWDARVKNLPYVMEYEQLPGECQRLILESDIVVFGGTDEESYITERLEKGLPVLRVSERIYKTGQWKFISPRGLRKKYNDHIRYRQAPVWMLCAGGYVASDFHLIHAYPDKMLKWGYFPETKEYDPIFLEEKRAGLLWAGRMIDWKHPELPVKLAAKLRDKGYSFHLKMIGGGEMEEEIRTLVKNLSLEEQVELCGFKSPEEVRKEMEKTAIFLFTSNYQEGWGAVLNESMNSGCAVVAGHGIGAVPFLIQDGYNGLLFKNESLEDLCVQTEKLLNSTELQQELGRNAYQTICEKWNAKVAGERLLLLAEEIVKKRKIRVWEDGPCSKANPVSPGSAYGKMKKEGKDKR